MTLSLNDSAGIPLHYLNRHTLITGQTGTGKTVTVLKMAESMAQRGIPVFMSDVKGDMSSLARSCQAQSLDVLSGAHQIPLWAFGADLLSRTMDLSDTQSATIEIAFTYAEQQGLPLDSLDDLRATLGDMQVNRAAISATLGQVSPASIGVIQRGILRLSNAGAGLLFGPTRIDIEALLSPGTVTILDATRLYQSPRVYGAFLLWLMREFWQRLPETGDLPAPRIALIFDEAHTIFSDISPALLRQTEQTARLIRSKGVALIWASQSPRDIPVIVSEQCATTLAHDRALGVGYARFQTLTPSGKLTAPKIIRPSIPNSGLDLAPVAPMATAAPPQPPEGQSLDRMALVAVAAVGIVAVAALSLMGWQFIAGIAITLAIASRSIR